MKRLCVRVSEILKINVATDDFVVRGKGDGGDFVMHGKDDGGDFVMHGKDDGGN